MSKLTKVERIEVANKIEDTLNQYCRVCPNGEQAVGGDSGTDDGTICQVCPVAWKLRYYGNKLDSKIVVATQYNEPRVTKKWTDEERKIAVELRSEGLTYDAIAIKLNRTKSSVSSQFKRLKENELDII